MKELFQKLSNVFNFFKEKRLVWGDPEKPADATAESTEEGAKAPESPEAPVAESQAAGAQAVSAAEGFDFGAEETPEGKVVAPPVVETPEGFVGTDEEGEVAEEGTAVAQGEGFDFGAEETPEGTIVASPVIETPEGFVGTDQGEASEEGTAVAQAPETTPEEEVVVPEASKEVAAVPPDEDE